MTRPFCAYAPDTEPPLLCAALGWALARPLQLALFAVLVAGAIWSFSQ